MTAGEGPLAAWGGRSLTADLGGPVHHVDFGGPADGPRVVLVHGLGGSHLNWCLAAPALARHARVRALDLPGFGRSEPGGRSAQVRANVAVLDRFVREVAGGPAVLVGNSMGGTVAILEAAAAPDVVSGLVLVDPALPAPRPAAVDPVVALRFALFALPGVGARSIALRRRRLGARATVLQTLALCGVDADALPPELVEESVALVERRRDPAAMDRAFVDAARSLLWINADPRGYRAAVDGLRMPVLLLHGARDRLVPVAAAREAARRHPSWHYEEWADVGHVPQLQVPDRFAGLVVEWLAAERAAPGAG